MTFRLLQTSSALIRSLGACSLLLLAGLWAPQAGWHARPAAAAGLVVNPTGVAPADVQNVQAAVDAGGTILLRATAASGAAAAFEFGTTGRVLLTRDVTILGETSNGHMTTIHGGDQPFRGEVPVRSTIRGIHFDESRSAAVRIIRSSGLEFSNNRVTRVIGTPFFDTMKGQAVWVNGPLNEITGTILIANNVVEDVNAALGYGVALFFYDAAAKIVGNVFRGTNTAGILVGGNTQPILIEDNLVVPGPERFPGGASIGNGIHAVFGGSISIRRNTVICENPLADGILLAGLADLPVTGSVIEQNDVTMRGSLYGALALYGAVSRSLVSQNNVMGGGRFALQVAEGFEPGVPAVANTFLGSNIARFDSQEADVFLDSTSRDTILRGHSGTVLDLGVNNQISGFAKRGGQTGLQIREALRVKRDLLKRLHSMEWSANAP